MGALPDPTTPPIISIDSPSESPASAQVWSNLALRIIYADGYGGVSLPSPLTTLTVPAGVGRASIAAASVPVEVARVLVWADTISIESAGTTFSTNHTVLYWPIDIAVPGQMPRIDLWAHDASRIGGEIWNTASVDALNTSWLPRPAGAVPDPRTAPVGLTLAGLGPGPHATFRKVRAAFAYQVSGTPPPGRDRLTTIGPWAEASAATPQDIVSIPAQSGLPSGVAALWVWVFGYADGTNLSDIYVYHVPVTAGATAAISFGTENSAIQEGMWDGAHFPDQYDDCWPNPTGGGLIRLRHQDGDVCWETDSITTRVKRLGRDVLVTPFRQLQTAPAVAMGRDPASGLPAYCPWPPMQTIVVTTPVPVDPVPPPGQPGCAQLKCGAARALTDHLDDVFTQFARWVNAGTAWIVGAAIGIIGTTVFSFFDALLTGGAGFAFTPVEWAMITSVAGYLSTVTASQLSQGLPDLDTGQLATLQKLCFCALTCDANQILLDDVQLRHWQSAVAGAAPGTFINLQQDFLGAILLWAANLDVANWANIAASGANSPISDCDSYVCP